MIYQVQEAEKATLTFGHQIHIVFTKFEEKKNPIYEISACLSAAQTLEKQQYEFAEHVRSLGERVTWFCAGVDAGA